MTETIKWTLHEQMKHTGVTVKKKDTKITLEPLKSSLANSSACKKQSNCQT